MRGVRTFAYAGMIILRARRTERNPSPAQAWCLTRWYVRWDGALLFDDLYVTAFNNRSSDIRFCTGIRSDVFSKVKRKKRWDSKKSKDFSVSHRWLMLEHTGSDMHGAVASGTSDEVVSKSMIADKTSSHANAPFMYVHSLCLKGLLHTSYQNRSAVPRTSAPSRSVIQGTLIRKDI